MITAMFDVIVVDDDELVRAWLGESFRDSEFRVAGEAAGVASALELIGRRHADVLLIDFHLGDDSGIDLLRQLRAGGNTTPAVLITATSHEGMNEIAREAGAQASVLKRAQPDVMLAEMRAVLDGEDGRFDAAHPKRPVGQRMLTPRERQILILVAGGLTNRQIAEQLSVGIESVKTYLKRAYTKLGVKTRAEAVAEATRQKLLS
jgi:DNA-binding NarL/FixJ family response regulator